ncbi:hypothetical protein HPB52_022236 [Rhipicephalus sanguineus]|uniref:Uncharacterized protein n=1 Tax=Rhipicephalus sanguineus TaxID=34632 RepID=A0A9D4YQU7_RHISA|nr:hypothetical protein HPB52_022236 [Rhipicephalus sanguineus]
MRPVSSNGRVLPCSCSIAATLDTPMNAISWDVSAVSDSGVASVNSRTGLFDAVPALNALLTIKSSRRNGTSRVASEIAVSNGLQTAHKTFLADDMGNLRVAAYGDMGRERCKGPSRTGLFGSVLAVDSLLNIKVPVMICTASDPCSISLTNGPQEAFKTSVTDTVDSLRLAAHGEEGRERFEGHSRTCFVGTVSAMASLHTIKAPLKVVSSAGVACRTTLLPNAPQSASAQDLPERHRGNLRLAAPGDMGHERERC